MLSYQHLITVWIGIFTLGWLKEEDKLPDGLREGKLLQKSVNCLL